MKLKLFILFAFSFIFALAANAQSLIEAVKAGNITDEEFEQLIESSSNEEKDAAYLETAKVCDTGMAQKLLAAGANANADTENNLYRQNNNMDSMEYKEKSGLRVSFGRDPRTIKTAAILAKNCEDEVIDFYIDKSPKQYSFKCAVCSDELEIAQKIADKYDITTQDFAKNRVLLYWAVRNSLENGSDEMLDLLLEEGADIDAAFGDDFLSRKQGSYKFSDEETDNGEEYAKQMWERFIEKGADVNKEYGDINVRKQPLIKHVINDPKKVKFLVDHGLELMTKNSNGQVTDTVLLKYLDKNLGTVLALIPNSMDPVEKAAYLSAKNKDGKTACELERAKEKPREKVIEKVCQNFVEEEIQQQLNGN